jgi:hypothetical protein
MQIGMRTSMVVPTIINTSLLPPMPKKSSAAPGTSCAERLPAIPAMARPPVIRERSL